MNEQTQKLMTALLSAPDLVQSLRKDPVGTLSRVASSDAAAPLFAAVKNAMANFGPLKDCQPPNPQSRLPGIADSGRLDGNAGTTSRSGDIPVVSIVSLGVVMASVTVLGTVCAVAVAREGNSGDR